MIKKASYILIISLSISLLLHSENRNEDHLSTLKRLIDANLPYDSLAPMDSVISWGEQISPMLEEENQMELFFVTKQLIVYLYSSRGSIGRSIDEARRMYEKAVNLDYDLGIALSSIAIGNAYYCSNMLPEAIASYREAIHYPVTVSDGNCFRERAILQLVPILLKEGEMEEVETYRSLFMKSESVQTSKVLQFFALVTDVSYYIHRNEIEKAYDSLLKAEQIYESDRQPYFYHFFYYAQGQYYEAIGEYQQALRYYDDVLGKIPRKMRSINYLQVAYTKANLLVKLDNKVDAAHLYDEISAITDSIVVPSYAHRINSLRASFQENRMKIENKVEANRIFFGELLIGLVLLTVIVYLAMHILKQNKKIVESTALLEQSKQEAENAMRTKSLLLSNMSHEIRTPLSALSGFSNLLTEQELDTETRRQCGEIIQQNSDLLLKLIDDVIDLSNLEIGNMEFNFGYHDAIAICHNVVDTVNKVKQTQADVLFETSMDSLQLYTDDSRLQQLLINLLINATKFTPQGSITLEIHKQSETDVFFSVTDTGCGIPLEKQSKIFNRFEKLNENAQGTGLGLSICQLIIERIGGKIWIDSSYTSGCRFCFVHPINPVGEEKEVQA